MIVRSTISGIGAGRAYAHIPGVELGQALRIQSEEGELSATVGGFENDSAVLELHGDPSGICAGDLVATDVSADCAPLGTALLGRALDAGARPLDHGPAPRGRRVRIRCVAPSPAMRAPVAAPLWTGVRAIDGLLTLGRGARVGVFGGPGTGKTSLLQAIAAGTAADAVVVALVGERGREAERWIRSCASEMTVVCATSDRSAAERVRAAHLAMAQSNALRSRGLHVLTILDSFARFGAASRDLAIARGEPPGRGGFPASVFFAMAQLAEVAGNTRTGSITLIATVLSDGDARDPLSDAARSLLDGHIELSERRAQAGRFPAVDIASSVSRTMSDVTTPTHQRAAANVRDALTRLARSEDARALGLASADARLTSAIEAEAAIEAWLCQGCEVADAAKTVAELLTTSERLEDGT